MSIKITDAYVNPNTVFTNSNYIIVAKILEYFILRANNDDIICSKDGNEIFLPDADYTSQYSGEEINEFISFMLEYEPQIQNYRDYTLNDFSDWTIEELAQGYSRIE